jgi:hypothetical protein
VTTVQRKIKLIPVEPVRYEKSGMFYDGQHGSGYETIDVPVYPPSPRGRLLQKLRESVRVPLASLAERLNVPPSDVSALERGAATLSPGDWVAVTRALKREHLSTK